MNKTSKSASLLLAGLLHVVPLATRILQSTPALAHSPIAIVMTWVIRAVAIAGAYHTVSAASAVLASPKTVSGTNGVRVSYQIRINDGENRTPESWRISGTLMNATGSTTLGMPPGLSLNRGTAIISGAPTSAGSFPTTITAYEKTGGDGASLTFTITFNFAATTEPTIITTHPAGAKLHLGETLNLSVTATGTPPFTYQWRKDNLDIPTATQSAFQILKVDASAAASYTVVVTGEGGSATSDPAIVTVTPLSIRIQSHTPAGTTLILETIPGRRYILEGSPSLLPTAWLNAGEVTAGTGSTPIVDSAATGSQNYWRYRPAP